MFSQLRTKLTILFGGLFGAGLLMMAVAVGAAIIGNAEQAVRGELASGGAVFDRLWTLRSDQLRDGAGLLSQDFGFRSAVATRDEATIGSALDNLKARLGIDIAYIVGADGTVMASDGATLGTAGRDVIDALQTQSDASGVLMIGDTPYQAISAPVMAPTLIGWVVFANKLDRAKMQSIERLSAIPLDAAVLHRDAAGHWIGPASVGQRPGFTRFVDQALRAPASGAQRIALPTGPAVALVQPIAAMNQGRPIALMLSYPLARALAPFRTLLGTVILVGLIGAALLIFGAWALARSLTRPISVLDDAVHRLQRGEAAEVEVTTRDEIGRLSASFNQMAAEIRERERRITHLALHDQTTDLPNRRAIEQAVGRLIEARDQGDECVPMLAAMGFDRFSEVRGAIGYELANALIGGIGTRLIELRPDDPVGRLTTDIVGLAFRAKDQAAGLRLLSDLQTALEAPLRLGENTVDVVLTAGLAVFGVHANSPDLLVERATIAMDQARANRRKLAVFDESAYGDPANNLSLISEMLAALDDGGMLIHHQPKYDFRRQEITGAEVLVRWRHPVRGPLAPDLFVSMAEETGHIRALTEWVLARAIQEQAILVAAGHDLLVSVNLSGRLLSDPEFAMVAVHMITNAKARICFEITETAVMENPDLALRLIADFAAAGIKISIDDYGTGLSSLVYLKQIAADELKIDKSFIFAISDGQRDALLVRSTIDLAHSLGMKVTAEGVETDIAMSLLASMGCDIAQGYYIAKPMPLSDLLGFLNDAKAVATTHAQRTLTQG